MGTKEEYDKTAEKYEESRKRPALNYCVYPSWIKTIGDLRNLDVLDLACGNGHSTRLLTRLNPRRLVGIDISPELIKLARKEEEKLNQGIEYFVGDVTKFDLTKLGKFDVVVAAFLTPYFPSLKVWNITINKISACLKKGGRFVHIASNPDVENSYDGYGVKYSPISKLKPGVKFRYENFNFYGERLGRYTIHWWPREVYEEVFRNQRFELTWKPLIITEQGLKEKGQEFWELMKKKPLYALFEARKK